MSAFTRLRARTLPAAISFLALVTAPYGGVQAQSNQTAAGSPAPSAATCADEGELKFLCGIRNPEDVAVITGTRWIVTGSFMEGGTGGLYAIDTDHPALIKIYGTHDAAARLDAKLYPDCTTPPDPARFSALGLSIRPRAGGGGMLYVVGGGARHGIEVFELDTSGSTPRATWIGCVRAPAGATLNAVAGMFPGEILTTAIFEAPLTFGDAMAGKATGNVYARTPGEPFRKLPNTNLAGDNGLEVTRDHRFMFVAATGTKQVFRYERAKMNEPPAVVNLPFGPDNLRWGPDGRLLVMGQQRGTGCATGTACPGMANVVGIDPVSLKTETIARFPATAHWSGLSGAVVVGNMLWLGSYQGDRIAYRPLRP